MVFQEQNRQQGKRRTVDIHYTENRQIGATADFLIRQ
jgi:hypothetical protein